MAALWSHKTLEDFEKTLTRGHETRQDPTHCEQIVALLQACRRDDEYFELYPQEDRDLIDSLIERFEAADFRPESPAIFF